MARDNISNTPEYRAWCGAKSRCADKKGYASKYYRDRGITVCDEWKCDFHAFFKHIGPKPTPKHTLDRIDNDRGYEPGNVRWATMTAQARNRRLPSPKPPSGPKQPTKEDKMMISKIRVLLAKIPKSRLASELGVQNTSTIDMWTSRGVVPVKYHPQIERLYNEFCK
jgi:hypothetical protein